MLFKELSIYLEKLEKTTSRNTIVEILSDLYKKSHASEIDKITYLLQGRVAPTYLHLEMGMADKMMLKALALAYDLSDDEVLKTYKKVGDLGKVSGEYAENTRRKHDSITVSDAFETLLKVAKTSGDGSVEAKIKLVADLLKAADSKSAYFISRIPVGNLRLGFSDMTVLDALSWMLSGTKEHRPRFETAYNVHPDLGLLAKTIKEKGAKGVEHMKPALFTPILMARAERLSSAEEVIEKIGKCAIESKYDGFRLQIHSDGKLVKIYTRSLEDATEMYPDIVEGVKLQVGLNKVILEGEAIAYNPDTLEFLPFQETTQRRRKYGVEEKAKEIPLKLICFELLYCNEKSYLTEPFSTRREKLEHVIKKGKTLEPSELKVTDDPKVVELFFDDAISRGLEGIIAKRLDGVYQAGARGFNWIKFKRSYSEHLNDTIDALVMGYNLGMGKRTDFGLGAFLIGIYDKKQDRFLTIAKIGTGLSDDEWRELFKRCQKLKAKEKPPLYEVSKMLEPDVWIEPEIVVEIRADEITRSPVHTAGRVMKPSKSGSALEVDIPGYALRFPRLEKFRDKKPEDTTALREIEEMFKQQSKHRVKGKE